MNFTTCGDDYNDDSDDAFKWNEYELMSLEAAESGSDWIGRRGLSPLFLCMMYGCGWAEKGNQERVYHSAGIS